MNFKINKSWACRNAANGITLFGVLLNQILKWVIFAHTEWMWIIFGVAAGSVGTDWIDGPVARYLDRKGYAGSISDFGKAVDRFRDKDFQLTMLFFLIWHPMVDYPLKWLLWPLVVAEIVLLVTLFRAVKKKADASATNWGRYKMFLECVVILASLLAILAKKHGIIIPTYITYPVFGTAIVAVFFAIMSIISHVTDPCKSQPPWPDDL